MFYNILHVEFNVLPECKVIVMGDEEPWKRFKQGADVIMTVLNTIIVNCIEDRLQGLKIGPRENQLESCCRNPGEK